MKYQRQSTNFKCFNENIRKFAEVPTTQLHSEILHILYDNNDILYSEMMRGEIVSNGPYNKGIEFVIYSKLEYFFAIFKRPRPKMFFCC